MNTYFKLELKKALFSWKTKISILIILAFYMIPYLQELTFPYPDLDGLNYYLKLYDSSYLGFVYPCVAAFVYSISIIKDKEKGFINKLLEIIDVKTYFKIKIIVNAIITVIVLIVSNIIIILYLILFYGIKNIAMDSMAWGLFSSVYEASPILYILLQLMVIVISSISFSTFILGVSTVVKNKFITYILPIFYVGITGILFELLALNNLINFNIIRLFDLRSFGNINILSIIIYDLILVFLGITLLYRFGYKKTLSLYEKKV